MGKKLVLVGLVEPQTADHVQAFKDWYLGNHIEDTYNCPNITAVRCYKAARGFLGDPPSGYLTEIRMASTTTGTLSAGLYNSMKLSTRTVSVFARSAMKG